MSSIKREEHPPELGYHRPAIIANVLVAAFLFAFAPSALAQDIVPVHGVVTEAASGVGVPLANVRVERTQTGAATDSTGHFDLLLAPGRYVLRVTALGYRSAHADLIVADPATLSEHPAPVSIRLVPTALALDEVVVSQDRPEGGSLTAPPHGVAATEDLLQRVPGVSLIQRANFAWEPTIRGLQNGQIGLTIDGMKIYGACVDRMDPASSYVEPENLARLEVARGAFDLGTASQIGGSVNLVTESPRFDAGVYLDAEGGATSAATGARGRTAVGIGGKRIAVRASGSYRESGDFAPGGGSAELAGSGFAKRNLAAAVSVRLGRMRHGHAAHTLTASALTDDAWLVGYPVLLMDATLAQARLVSLKHAWEPHAHHLAEGAMQGDTYLEAVTTRLYRNRVDHWMDDRDRDVRERAVMRGMFMPMYGYTETWGGLTEATAVAGIHRFALTLDAHHVTQFGDMDMFSVFEGIPDMYLLNVGDARTLNTAATLAHQVPVGRVTLRSSARLDAAWRDVEHEDMRTLFRQRYGASETAQRYVLPSASLSAEVAVRPTTRLRLSLARASRLPTLVENYGHYVYNYVDGFFYTGDPDLAPETSTQVEVGAEHVSRRLAVQGAVYWNELRDLAVGLDDDGLGALSGSAYRFRRYTNARSGVLAGGEVGLLVPLAWGFEVAASASYTYGHNRTLDEPLPQIAPVSGVVALRWDETDGRFWAEAESRWAGPQNRAARTVSLEDRTDGYNILGLRAGAHLGAGTTLKLAADNLLDTYYVEHQAIGNLPSRGRDFSVALAISL